MVRKDYELLWQQVVSLVSERLHHNKKLLVICVVPHSSIIEFFTEVGYRVPFLTENTIIPTPEALHVTWKTLEKSGRVRTGA